MVTDCENMYCHAGRFIDVSDSENTPDWILVAFMEEKIVHCESDDCKSKLSVKTSNGTECVHVGDFICRCENGNLSVIKS